METTRVAYLVNQYPKGSHTFIRREVAALEALGVDVTRVSVRRPRETLIDDADRAEEKKTRVILDAGPFGLAWATLACALTRPLRFARALALARRVGKRSERGFVYHLIYLAEACALVGILRRVRVAHVHAHFGTNATVVAMLTRALGGPPFSFTVHGPEEFDKAPLLALGTKIDHAKFVAAISDYGRSQLMRQCATDAWDKIVVVPCGLDEAFLDARASAVPDTHDLVCVGRLNEQKGHLVLCEALGLLRARGVACRVVCVGDGELRGAVEAACARLGLNEGALTLAGWKSTTDVRAAIEASRALVLPSFAEGLPVVIMEALALGRPVVSTYVAGIPELVRDNAEGWLVPAGSASALADALAALLTTEPRRLTEMGASGRARVLERHDVRSSAAQLKALFMQPSPGASS